MYVEGAVGLEGFPQMHVIGNPYILLKSGARVWGFCDLCDSLLKQPPGGREGTTLQGVAKGIPGKPTLTRHQG